MNQRSITLFASLALLCAVSFGCTAVEHVTMWGNVDQATAVLEPTEGHDAHGTVQFLQLQEGVKVIADIRGLEPNSTHAIHVHEFGDRTSEDGASAGGHYNPEDHPHNLPHTTPRHAGDLGNITADADGRARKEIVVNNMSVAEMENPVIGRAVVVHANADTGEGESGEAGPRVAVGVIGIANADRPEGL